MSLKILATGDLHLGKKSSSVPENAEEGSTKFTWNRIVDWSIKSGIDILVLTGDIVDQDNRYFEAIGSLQSGFEKLKKADIAVYLVAGNHDYNVLPQIAGNGKCNNVHLLGSNGEWEVKIFSKKGEQVQFVGWSFPKQFETNDPLLNFNGKLLDHNIPAIGLLHGDVDIPESKYAPLDSGRFLNKPIDAWILGHIHKPQVLRESGPPVWYPGSPHSLSSKEPGVHGPILLTIENKDDIKISKIPLSPVRYEKISIDITNSSEEEGLRDTVTSGLLNDANTKIDELEGVAFLIYDISLEGEHSNIKDLERWALPIVDAYDQEIETETRLTVRKVLVNAKPKLENIENLAKLSTPAGVLAKTILAIRNEDSNEFLYKLVKSWKLNYRKIITSGTYQALNSTGRFDDKTELEVKQYILHECNHLLGELLGQKTL
jgi:exonuclease SbcD